MEWMLTRDELAEEVVKPIPPSPESIDWLLRDEKSQIDGLEWLAQLMEFTAKAQARKIVEWFESLCTNEEHIAGYEHLRWDCETCTQQFRKEVGL